MIVQLTNGEVGFVGICHQGEETQVRLLDDDGIPTDDIISGIVKEILDDN